MTDTIDTPLNGPLGTTSATNRPRRSIRLAADREAPQRRGSQADPVADVFVPEPLEDLLEEDVADLLETVTAPPQRYSDASSAPVAADRKRYEAHREAVLRAFGNLPEEAQRTEVEIYDAGVAAGQRPAFAALTAHREMAAALLACGATNDEAALYAGVSTQSVQKWKAEEVFRKRIEELQSTIMGSIAGNLLVELQRRTSGKHLRKMEVNDLLRIFDRVAGTRGAGGARGTAAATVNIGSITVSNYQDLLDRLFNHDAQQGSADDAGQESGDFPVYGPGVVPLPGGGSLRAGEVSGPLSRETRGEE